MYSSSGHIARPLHSLKGPEDRDVEDAARTAVSGHVITGTGGVGKTCLAAEYCRRVADGADGGVDVLIWVTANSTPAVAGAYAQAARELELVPNSENTASAAEQFLNWLGDTDRGWLIVRDDVHFPGAAPWRGCGHLGALLAAAGSSPPPSAVRETWSQQVVTHCCLLVFPLSRNPFSTCATPCNGPCPQVQTQSWQVSPMILVIFPWLCRGLPRTSTSTSTGSVPCRPGSDPWPPGRDGSCPHRGLHPTVPSKATETCGCVDDGDAGKLKIILASCRSPAVYAFNLPATIYCPGLLVRFADDALLGAR